MVDGPEPDAEPTASSPISGREHRTYLVDLAFRMLGNIQDAEDVVQEAFSRLLDRDLASIDDARGWLIVVVSRICLDQLRSARKRRETGAPTRRHRRDRRERSAALPDPGRPRHARRQHPHGAARRAATADARPSARCSCCTTSSSSPSTRSGRSSIAHRPRAVSSRAGPGIASRPKPGPIAFEPDLAEQQRVAQRFIAVCAGGDLDALVELLDPDVVGDVELGPGAPHAPLHGRDVIAPNLLKFFGPKSASDARVAADQRQSGRARVPQPRTRRHVAATRRATDSSTTCTPSPTRNNWR